MARFAAVIRRFHTLVSSVRGQFFAAVLLLVFLGLVVLGTSFVSTPTYPEVAEISSSSWTQDEYTNYLTELAREKGAVYAFDVLHRSSFPFGINTHALGHPLGYILHEEKGSSAITFCTNRYHDDSCMHGVVIQEFIVEGRNALATLAKECENVGRGKAEYADCFHGIGHGIVAYLPYEYEEAIEQCKEVASVATQADPSTDHQGLYVWRQCVDGATMEMLQGTHDADAWAEHAPKFMPDADLRMPCSAEFVPPEVRSSCYIYIRSRMLKAAGIERTDSSFEHTEYVRALSSCEAIPDNNDRKYCYGGFGMHFVYAVNGNNDRIFGEMGESEMRKVHELCMLASELEGQSPCTVTAAETILGKSRQPKSAARFCALAPDSVIKDRCYIALIGIGPLYAPGTEQELCMNVPSEYQERCRSSAMPMR